MSSQPSSFGSPKTPEELREWVLASSTDPNRPRPQQDIQFDSEVRNHPDSSPLIPMGRLRRPAPLPVPDTMVTRPSRIDPFSELQRHTLHPTEYKPGELHPNPNSAINPLPEIVADPNQAQTIAPDAELHEEHSCPECGSPVDPHAHFCPACGEGLTDETQVESNTEAGDRRHWKCDNCGSEVTSQGSDRTLHCPFCESDYVAEIDPRESGRQRPEFVIGFSLTIEQAAELVARWMDSNQWYHPKDLKNARVVEKLRGVYVPFWSFSTLASSVWNASIGEYWYSTETYTVRVNGKSETRTRRVRHTEWWPLSGRHHQYYSGYLVSGSHGLSQQEADSLLPYNLPALQRYKPYFLAGWFAEEYSVDRQQAMAKSLEQFSTWEENNVRAFLPGDTSAQVAVNTQFSQTQSDLCLLPIYMLTYVYNNQQYRVLLNGQTGRITGRKPIWRARVVWVVGWVIGLLVLIGIIALVMQLH